MSSSEQGPLPESVLNLLQNTNFIHLGTCLNNTPHVSLMNYSFIKPSDTFESQNKTTDSVNTDYYILIATPKNTNKYENLTKNPVCSILVHDWTTSSASSSSSDKLLKMLMDLNQSELSELSCTLTGHVAKFLNDGDEKELLYYKTLHLGNHPDAKCFIDGDNVALILIKIDGSKVVDSNNNIAQYK